MSTIDLVEVARKRVESAQALLDKRERTATARANMANDYDRGKGMRVRAIAEKYAVSEETVRVGLKAQGVYQPQKRVKITDELREQVTADLKAQKSIGEIASNYGISASSVKKIAVDAGVVAKGPGRPRRTDEDMAAVKDLDTDARAIYGAGLLALGTQLRAWEKRKAAESVTQADPTAPAEPAPDDDNLSW